VLKIVTLLIYFNFALKFPKNGSFLTRNFAFVDESFPAKIFREIDFPTIFRQLSIWYLKQQFSPIIFYDATDCRSILGHRWTFGHNLQDEVTLLLSLLVLPWCACVCAVLFLLLTAFAIFTIFKFLFSCVWITSSDFAASTEFETAVWHKQNKPGTHLNSAWPSLRGLVHWVPVKAEGVNWHTVRCTSSVSMVSQCKLVSASELCKQRLIFV